MCRMMSHLLDNPHQCVFSDLWWLNDSLNSHAYTSCLWARGGDDADGEWRMSRAVIIRALYLCFNQKQWCTIHMSSFPVISGPNDNLGGGRCLSLTQAPITDHLHWPYIIGLLLLTTHHQTWRPGVIEHCQHQHGARRHRTETLAPSMQTPHRNPLNIHRIQIRYISSGYY